MEAGLTLVSQIINPVQSGLPQFLVGKVRHIDGLGLPVRSPSATRILAVTNQLLLFRINRNNGLLILNKSLDLLIDVVELLLPVGVPSSFLSFGIRRQRIPLCLEDFWNRWD